MSTKVNFICVPFFIAFIPFFVTFKSKMKECFRTEKIFQRKRRLGKNMKKEESCENLTIKF